MKDHHFKKNICRDMKRYIAILFASILLASCGGVSSDAKKAAKLTNKSIEKTNKMKLKEAEKLFKKSKEILDKYEEHKKRDKFYKIYIEKRDKGRKK